MRRPKTQIRTDCKASTCKMEVVSVHFSYQSHHNEIISYHFMTLTDYHIA